MWPCPGRRASLEGAGYHVVPKGHGDLRPQSWPEASPRALVGAVHTHASLAELCYSPDLPIISPLYPQLPCSTPRMNGATGSKRPPAWRGCWLVSLILFRVTPCCLEHLRVRVLSPAPHSEITRQCPPFFSTSKHPLSLLHPALRAQKGCSSLCSIYLLPFTSVALINCAQSSPTLAPAPSLTTPRTPAAITPSPDSALARLLSPQGQ